LVVRAVVFGATNGVDWADLLQTVSPIQLFRGATESAHANGTLQFALPNSEGSEPQTIQLRYRTLGFTHGEAELGSYEADGSWSGHLVVIAENALIDLTIGQLNDSRFDISFDPPHVTIEADESFLAGRSPLIGIQDGMMVCYRAYPEETTFEASKAWTDPIFREELRQVGQRAAESED
ncbi:MAG: hypothetical protein WC485_12665, partial [Opitutaceae bacterium]